jgi:hypothetical protein
MGDSQGACAFLLVHDADRLYFLFWKMQDLSIGRFDLVSLSGSTDAVINPAKNSALRESGVGRNPVLKWQKAPEPV